MKAILLNLSSTYLQHEQAELFFCNIMFQKKEY